MDHLGHEPGLRMGVAHPRKNLGPERLGYRVGRVQSPSVDAAAEPEHPSEWLGKAVGKKLWHDFRTPAAATTSLVNLFKELHKVKADVLAHAIQEGSAQGPSRQQRITRSNSGASAASDPR